MGSINRVRRNVKINDRRTSVMMELELWDALYEICERTGKSVHDVCGQVRDGLDSGDNFTAALRVFIVNYYRSSEMNARPRDAA